MKQQLVSLLIALTAVLIGGGCQSNNDDPAAGEPKPLPARSFARQWSTQLNVDENNPVQELHVRDNAVYLYMRSHHVFVVDRAGGQLMHHNPVAPAEVKLFPPIVLPDRVVFPRAAGLEVYDIRGRKLESIDLDYTIRSPGVGHENRIYIGANAPTGGGGRVAAIDVTRKYAHTRWQLMTFGAVSAAPALYEGVVFIGSEDGRIYAVSLDRDAYWSLENGVFLTYGAIKADLKADEFGVYIASTDSKLYCVDRSSGKVKWQYFGGASLVVAPVVTEGRVYQAIPRKGVAAINKTEGKFNRDALWVAEGAVQFLAEDDNYAYVRNRKNEIFAIDLQTGKAKFKSSRADFDVFGTNMRGDGIIYASTSSGQVMAIRPVLKPGTVGELVLEVTPVDSIAMAN